MKGITTLIVLLALPITAQAELNLVYEAQDSGWKDPARADPYARPSLLSTSQSYLRFGGSLATVDSDDATGLPPSRSTDIDFQNAWGGNVAYGIDWGRFLGSTQDNAFALSFRTDLELGFESLFYDGFLTSAAEVSAGGGSIESWSLTLNAFVDVELPGRLSLFAGGGAGPALMTRREDGSSVGDENIVAQWLAGISIEVQSGVELYTAFRQRIYVTDPAFKGVEAANLKSSAFEVGLKIDF